MGIMFYNNYKAEKIQNTVVCIFSTNTRSKLNLSRVEFLLFKSKVREEANSLDPLIFELLTGIRNQLEITRMIKCSL